MNGKDGSSENFASLSGVSAPDLNDTIGTGIRYGRQGDVSCVRTYRDGKSQHQGSQITAGIK